MTTQSTSRQGHQCSRLAHLLGRLVIKVSGWQVAGGPPDTTHTSNWDLIYLVATAFCFHLRIHWLGKDSLFRTPLGPLLTFIGGIPVDRSRSNNLVANLAETILASDGFILVVPPAGTRKRTEYWKSGFYQIARAANIPIVCGYLDYPNKVAGLGFTFTPTDNVRQDMDQVRAFYAPMVGKYPQRASVIILREEEQDS
jgi:1-acyl-sn-glycerol-3-phosphate acyltransferase